MTPDELYRQLQRELDSFEAAQTFKYEVPLEGEQGGTVPVRGRQCVMLASNNYLGLANHPRVPESIRNQVSQHGWCRDEFTSLGGFSPQLYVREGRRMLADAVSGAIPAAIDGCDALDARGKRLARTSNKVC